MTLFTQNAHDLNSSILFLSFNFALSQMYVLVAGWQKIFIIFWSVYTGIKLGYFKTSFGITHNKGKTYLSILLAN
jgi:hypothetical protein